MPLWSEPRTRQRRRQQGTDLRRGIMEARLLKPSRITVSQLLGVEDPHPATPFRLAMAKHNLKWQLNVVRAKAGLPSRMAVPKRIAQKARSKLKRSNDGVLPSLRGEQLEQLLQLERRRVAARTHHQLKELQQVLKKARAFLLRKLIRKAREATGEAPGSAASRAAENRLRVVKAMPVAFLAEAARARAGIETPERDLSRLEPRDGASSDWDKIMMELPEVCSAIERQLLASTAVQQQLDKLRAATDAVRHHEQQTPTAIPVKEPKAPKSATPRRGKVAPAGRLGAGQSLFVESLADLDKLEEAQAEVEAEPDGLAGLGSAREKYDQEGKPQKKKNVISSSGNRMGQRQRQKLMGLSSGSTSSSSAPAKKVARVGSKALGGKSLASRNLSAKKDYAPKDSSHATGIRAEHRGQESSMESLHPSWAAKLRGRETATIKTFEGKRVVFD